MIQKILIEGVRTHEHTAIELSRLTCLVGPNGSGKSTVLNTFVVFASKGTLLPFWQRIGSNTSRIEVNTSNGTFASPAVKSVPGEPEEQTSGPMLVIPCRPDPRVIRLPSTFAEAKPALGFRGEQLAAVLAMWKLVDEQKFQTVVQELQQIVPNLENIRPNTTILDFDQPAFELLFDFRGAHGIPAQAVSEGTLLALSLLTAVHSHDARSPAEGDLYPVVLIDDIDRGLHPDAQVELVRKLRSLAEAKELQIVMTTHSPFVVDALEPQEVYVLKIDESVGATRCRRLSEIPGAGKFRGILSTGELWSSHGESWVTQEEKPELP